MGKSDAHVLDGSPIVTKFNGKKYSWRQLPRREQRKIRPRLMEIAAIVNEGSTGSNMMRATVGLEFIDKMLLFCEEFNPSMIPDLDDMDDYIQENQQVGFQELAEGVYQPLYKAWLEPWVTDTSESKGSAKKKQD